MTDVALERIGQISMRVHDIKRATRFYADVLGLPLLFSVSGMSFFRLGDIRLMLSPPSEPQFDHPGSILYYTVTDIRQVHAALRERGVQFEDEPHVVADMGTYELWMAFFRDSENNVLALMSEVPKG
jgi:predicted enzyme related to lactoylglutathione lyase